jgi:hypothetical protein
VALPSRIGCLINVSGTSHTHATEHRTDLISALQGLLQWAHTFSQGRDNVSAERPAGYIPTPRQRGSKRTLQGCWATLRLWHHRLSKGHVTPMIPASNPRRGASSGHLSPLMGHPVTLIIRHLYPQMGAPAWASTCSRPPARKIVDC